MTTYVTYEMNSETIVKGKKIIDFIKVPKSFDSMMDALDFAFAKALEPRTNGYERVATVDCNDDGDIQITISNQPSAHTLRKLSGEI